MYTSWGHLTTAQAGEKHRRRYLNTKTMDRSLSRDRTFVHNHKGADTQKSLSAATLQRVCVHVVMSAATLQRVHTQASTSRPIPRYAKI